LSLYQVVIRPGFTSLNSRRGVHHVTELKRRVFKAFPDRQPRIRDHINFWQAAATKQLVLTYEPYLSPSVPILHTEANAFSSRYPNPKW
jgi:hypothetical protein